MTYKALISFLLLQAGFSLFTDAQPVTTPDNSYGSGGTKVTTVTDDGFGMRTTTEEYYDNDKPPKLREKTVRIKNRIEGDSTIKTYTFSNKGDTTGTREKVLDKDEKEIYYHEVHYRSGSPKSGKRWIRLPDGTLEESEWNENTGTFERKRNTYQLSPDKLQQKEKTFDLSLGYSYLLMNSDGNSESFPLGGHMNLAYFLSHRLALLGDFSVHSKKEGDFKLMLAYLMGGVQYNLLKERQKAMMLYSRLLLGLALERQRYSFGSESNTDRASSFAIAAGLGFYFPITEQIGINLLADYIRTRFNSNPQNNICLGAGVKFNLGKKYMV